MPLELRCPQCNQMLRVGDDAPGKRVRCPQCQTIFTAPGVSPPAPPPAAIQPPVAPPPAAPPPFVPPPPVAPPPAPAANPFAPSAPSANPFAPVAPAPPVNPFAPSAAPGGANPFAAPPKPSSFADLNAPGTAPPPQKPTGDPLNPYASPNFSAYTAPPTYEEPPRPGLPWENPGPSPETFLETTKLLLISPAEAFGQMHLQGNIGRPFLYYLLGLAITLAATMIWVIPLLLLQKNNIGRPEQVFLHLGMRLVVVFILAAVVHLGLLLVSGARHGYETTLRVIAYSLGATAVVNLVPFIGPPAALLWAMIASVIGLTRTHRCNGGQGLFAIMFPLLLCCVVPCGVFILIGIIAAAAR